MFVALLAAVAVQAVVAAPAVSDDRAGDRREIVAGAEAWGGAFVSGDAGVIDRLLTDEFIGTSKAGVRYGKAEIRAWVIQGPNLASNRTVVEAIRFYGDTAVAVGFDEFVTAPPERERRKSIWTDVWIKRDGRWRVGAAQDMAGKVD
jgi:uncharacterized protein DUF4440